MHVPGALRARPRRTTEVADAGDVRARRRPRGHRTSSRREALEFLDRPRSASSARGARELLARAPSALRAPRAPASCRTSCRRRPPSATATGGSRRSRRRSPTGASRSPGPVDRKMVINALNSGAKVFMADFEDANSPTWENCIEGQRNLHRRARPHDRARHAARSGTALNDETGGAVRAAARLAPGGAALRGRRRADVRRRCSTSASTSSATTARERPLLLPAEARVAPRGAALERRLRLGAGRGSASPRGTIKATVLIETILAAFEMDEILYELREHSAGLNAGRWDYIFSVIKKLGAPARVRAARPRAT